MGSTVHYIFKGQLGSHVLFFTEVPLPTHLRILKLILRKLDGYKFQCFFVVTDNAANMRHAFELMQQADNDEESEVEDEDDSSLTHWMPHH